MRRDTLLGRGANTHRAKQPAGKCWQALPSFRRASRRRSSSLGPLGSPRSGCRDRGFGDSDCPIHEDGACTAMVSSRTAPAKGLAVVPFDVRWRRSPATNPQETVVGLNLAVGGVTPFMRSAFRSESRSTKRSATRQRQSEQAPAPSPKHLSRLAGGVRSRRTRGREATAPFRRARDSPCPRITFQNIWTWLPYAFCQHRPSSAMKPGLGIGLTAQGPARRTNQGHLGQVSRWRCHR